MATARPPSSTSILFEAVLPDGETTTLLDLGTTGGYLGRPVVPAGRVVATPAALASLAVWRREGMATDVLSRHFTGVWGDLGLEDRLANDRDVLDGGRVLSRYDGPGGRDGGLSVYVITEHDRSVTTVLRPEDY